MGLAQAETDHLSETKIYNLHPYKERRSASRHFYTGFLPPPHHHRGLCPDLTIETPTLKLYFTLTW